MNLTNPNNLRYTLGTYAACVVAVWLTTTPVSAAAADNVWSTPFSPTKGQWLAYEVQRDIEQLTNLWPQRVAVVVTADPKKEAVDIFVTPTPGHSLTGESQSQAQTQTVCQANKSALQQRAKRTLRQYDWALNGAVFVTCL